MIDTTIGKQLINYTRTVIRSCYTGTLNLIQKHFHSDIVWINSLTSQYLYGYCSVSSGLSKSPRLNCSRIIYRHSHLLQISANTWTVTCEYSVLRHPEAQSTPEYYCSCFTWKEEHQDVKLIYVHNSPCYNPVPESHPISFQGRHAQIYRISPNEIVYAEANNIYSNLHCVLGQVEISHSISQLEELLPGYFMRTHRSLIVNKQYVRRIYRYGLELLDGVHLPVPEKRYMKVVCWLET